MEFAPRPEMKPEAAAFNHAVTRVVLDAEDLVRSVGPEGLYDQWQEQQEMLNLERSVGPMGTVRRMCAENEVDCHLREIVDKYGMDAIEEMTDVEMALEDLSELLMGEKYPLIDERGSLVTTQKREETVETPDGATQMISYTHYRVVGGEVVAEDYAYDKSEIPVGWYGKQHLNNMIAQGKAMGMNAMPITEDQTEALMAGLNDWQSTLDYLAQFKGQGSAVMLRAIQGVISGAPYDER